MSLEPSDPAEWNIEETISNISYLDPTLGPHVENFRSHEIDGKLLLLLVEIVTQNLILLMQVKPYCCWPLIWWWNTWDWNLDQLWKSATLSISWKERNTCPSDKKTHTDCRLNMFLIYQQLYFTYTFEWYINMAFIYNRIRILSIIYYTNHRVKYIHLHVVSSNILVLYRMLSLLCPFSFFYFYFFHILHWPITQWIR